MARRPLCAVHARAGRVLLACSAALALASCFIEERSYDPSIPRPLETVGNAALPGDPCEDYCTAVQANCTGAFQVYLNTSDCLNICAQLPPGDDLADPTGTNTVACRRRNAELATSEKNVYCPAAGPAGAGMCGTNCEAYCGLREAFCTGVQRDVDAEKCETQCPALLQEDFRPDPRATGDTLQCRINHLINASQSPADAELHCWHTSVAPDVLMPTAAPCAAANDAPADCERYCNLVMFACTGANQVYEDTSQCIAGCQVHPLGVTSDRGEQPSHNTIGCRTYHAYNALNDPTVHCSHAGPVGDGHCGARNGNNCQSYCRILKHACTERFFDEYLPNATVPLSLPANPTDDALGNCPVVCEVELGGAANLGAAPDSRYSITTAPSVTSEDDSSLQGDKGDVLQCRVYHAIRALSDEADCDAAFGEGSCE